MTPRKPRSADRNDPLVPVERLRWSCDPARFDFETTADLSDCPINIIGQDRAQEALNLGLTVAGDGFNIFVTGDVGSGRSTVVRRILEGLERGDRQPDDLVYVYNFQDADQPRCLIFPAGQGCRFRHALAEMIEGLQIELPKLFESEGYSRHRATMFETAAREQKSRLKEFEAGIQERGFMLVQVQVGPLTRPQIVPVFEDKPVDMDQLEALVEEGKFDRAAFDKLQETLPELRVEMESLGKTFRNLDRGVRRDLAEIDRELVRPLIEEALSDVRQRFETEGLSTYLERLGEDIIDHIELFRDSIEPHEAGGAESALGHDTDAAEELVRYEANVVVVENAETRGRPIIWETAPSYRNLFGTIERTRGEGGDWDTNHTRIKAGSLLRANGGILVLDAMDVMVEPGVWAALKRTLRTRKLEIQPFDPFHAVTGVSLKPEPLPIDVKVVMIGTRQIYRMLHTLDEDFKKIFKVKAEFAMQTSLSEEEVRNYVCFVHKKVGDDGLPHFHRAAVAAVVEYGVRLSGHHEKLTTRFNEITDLIRESAYWAGREDAEFVLVAHVDRAIRAKIHRVNLVEELLRERIAEGLVLLDLEGAKVGQVNGLAVLDQGDHAFGQPSRITATTAMGRAGILDLDREADMSGSIHTKGVLILSGFLRARFAQDKPLTLTASLSFEQNYGGVDGDSASSAELYALLSSLSEVPLDQSIAVTGSVNQKGEVQPIGGVNEKVEGFFELCKLTGLTGKQGVMIPRRNLPQLMLRKRVVDAVREKQFRIWAVSTIEEGLEVLTGVPAASLDDEGRYTPESTFGRADAKLSWLAEQVGKFGRADMGQ